MKLLTDNIPLDRRTNVVWRDGYFEAGRLFGRHETAGAADTGTFRRSQGSNTGRAYRRIWCGGKNLSSHLCNTPPGCCSRSITSLCLPQIGDCFKSFFIKKGRFPDRDLPFLALPNTLDAILGAYRLLEMLGLLRRRDPCRACQWGHPHWWTKTNGIQIPGSVHMPFVW